MYTFLKGVIWCLSDIKICWLCNTRWKLGKYQDFRLFYESARLLKRERERWERKKAGIRASIVSVLINFA